MSISTEGEVKKSRMSGFANGEDCISNLPESITSRILSCLPTKNAVRTSVLSKDWEFKWTSIYNIKIEDSSNGVYTTASFVNYVDRILFLAHNIRTFHLQCRKVCDSSRVIGWISAALSRNVENLELNYVTLRGIPLPRCLLNRTSLRSLKLRSPCSFKVPSENCFANLKSLYFYQVEIRNALSNTDTLTFTFPVLETMELRECKWVNVKFVEINAPTLTKFLSNTRDDAQVDDYSINIIGARLTDFESSGWLPENLFIGIGSSIARATLTNVALTHEGEFCDLHLFESGLLVRKWLNGFQSLEDLELCDWITMAIAQSEQGLALPRYEKLRRLTVDAFTNVEVLLEMLHAAPFLKSLVVHMAYYETPPPNDYEAVESMPYCLSNHLEEVEILDYGFSPSMYDFHLEKFLVKNGLRLKAFHLRCPIKEIIPSIMKNLLTFPKGSDCLTFVIH